MTSNSAAERTARDLVKKSRSSFYWAMRVLPRQKRMAMYAVYAFCRTVDDIADGPDGESEKMSRLKFWRQELDRLFKGTPSQPVAMALCRPVRVYGLGQDDFLAVIEGMERDARSSVRIIDEADLAAYCDAVACSVGRLANRIFGVDAKAGNDIAAALGQALQLTNILRDVAEDAACDRLYVPLSLLHRHGIDSDIPAVAIGHPEFPAACRELAATARRHYQDADQLLGRYDRSRMRPAVLMMHTYRRILDRLQKRGWDDLEKPVGLSGPEKLLILLRYGWLSL